MACRPARSRSNYCAKKRRRSRKRKSCRPGKITRNPFFNYLRWFRKKHCGLSAVQIAKQGAKCWCKMSDGQRKKFYKEACKAPPMRRRGRSRSRKGKRRGHSRCGRRSGGHRKRRSSRRRSRGKKRGCSSACSRPRRAKSSGGCN